MTAYQLQKDLGEEIEEILKDMMLKNVKGELVKIKAYPQSLPKRIQKVQGADEQEDIMPEGEEENFYPYCIVSLDSGGLNESVHQIKMIMIFGIFDDDVECQGHQVIVNMFHKIAERFIENPILKDKYRMNDNAGIEWILDTEDRYPYYFGAIEMTWDTFFVRREDRYV